MKTALMKLSIITILLLFAGYHSRAQYYFYDDKYMDNDRLFEVGATLGIMNTAADVGEKKGSGLSLWHYDWKSVKPDFGIYCAFMYKSLIDARLQLTKGTAAGFDGNSNSKYIRIRNLNFQSNIFELSLTGALYPIMLFNTDFQLPVDPYLMAGVGVFSFYPKIKYNGELLNARALNTEGQNSELYPNRKQYSLRAISLPIGGGLKYEFSGIYNIRMELMYRFTTTDYMDDASTTYVERAAFPDEQTYRLAHRYLEKNRRLNYTGKSRANSGNKDAFFTINANFGYVIGREKRKYGRTR